MKSMVPVRSITVLETAAIVFSSVVGVGVLALPRFAALAGETGAPLVTLLAILLVMLGVTIVTTLGRRFPQNSFVSYNEIILGKWLGKVGPLLLAVLFLIITALTAREFGKVTITSVLPQTPVEVITLVMLVLAMVTSRNNLTTFAYINTFYIPFQLVPAFIIVVLSLKNAHWINVLPVTGGSISTFGNGILVVAALCQAGFVLTIVIPGMRHPQKALRGGLIGIAVAGLLYLSIVIACVSVFGAEGTKVLYWPTLELAKTTQIPGQILERLDAIFISVWVIAVFTTLYSTYFFTVWVLKDIFHLQDHKFWSITLLPVVFLLAMMPPDIFYLYPVIETVGKWGLLLTMGYPLLLWLVAVIRGKRGQSDASQSSRSSPESSSEPQQ